MNKNIFGEPLITCSNDPVTGYFRTGCCETDDSDYGVHTVCVETTKEFLEFSKSIGNDLSTPIPEYGFQGVNPGDKWCLCATRWKEAFENIESTIYYELQNNNVVKFFVGPFEEQDVLIRLREIKKIIPDAFIYNP